MVFYDQHFTPNCVSIAKPLFALAIGQKRRGKAKVNSGAFWKLKPNDCFCSSLKEKLLKSVVFAHPIFSHPLILSIKAFLDGHGAVLSEKAPGEKKACPTAVSK